MIELPSPYVHYYNRGVNKEAIFFSNENYAYLIRLFEKILSYYQVYLVAYCLMPNHYHILLKHENPLEGSRFLQRTFNSYTQSINKQISRVGTLFQGNVKKRFIEDVGYLSELIFYIHLNPVKRGLCRHPNEWAFSDYREWIGLIKSSRPIIKECNEIFGSPEENRELMEIEVENLRRRLRSTLTRF
jgi:putative transposase